MAKIYCVLQVTTESVSLRKCPYDKWLTDKAYLSAITVTNISQSFYLQDGGKNQQNCVTVTLCIAQKNQKSQCTATSRRKKWMCSPKLSTAGHLRFESSNTYQSFNSINQKICADLCYTSISSRNGDNNFHVEFDERSPCGCISVVPARRCNAMRW